MHPTAADEPLRLPPGAAARRCPDCDHVFLVWSDLWDCGCTWRCWCCLEAKKSAA